MILLCGGGPPGLPIARRLVQSSLRPILNTILHPGFAGGCATFARTSRTLRPGAARRLVIPVRGAAGFSLGRCRSQRVAVQSS
jgi:hypothetical protein